MKRVVIALFALALLLPAAGHAAPQPNAWQVYTPGNGLIERDSYAVASDARGGIWVGHVSGGRGIYRRGGLTYIRADGSFRQYLEEPFVSCSSVDALAPTAEGWTWIWLSGYHDYGHNDHTQRCRANYGIPGNYGAAGHEDFTTAALGVIAPDGTPQMLPKEQIPPDITRGMVTDARGRVWVGIRSGLSVREPDGLWRSFGIWDGSGITSALAVSADGSQIAVGSSSGAVATLKILDAQTEQATQLPRPTAATDQPVVDLAFSPQGVLTVALGGAVYDYTPERATWWEYPLSTGDQTYGVRLAYAAGMLWVGSPQLGVRYLNQGTWIAPPADRWPLPGAGANALRPFGDGLLIATSQGVIQLHTGVPLPDPAGAQAAFEALWQRTNTSTGNSWVWGPQARNQRFEPYAEGPGGTRYVRYYDKARMELNDPSGDPNAPWFVTNGLLVVELVRGKVQLGNDPERGGCPVATGPMCPSYQQIAGDLSSETNQLAPRYTDFTARLGAVESRMGQTVAATLVRQTLFDPPVDGQERALASAPTTIAAYDRITGHNIPRLFWDFMQRQPVDALFAFGRPIAEPYWVRTELGGKAQWVMVQLFERRVLTYTPGNAPAWQVEMGNVGQHYFLWRYPGG